MTSRILYPKMHDKEWLRKRYVEELWTLQQMADVIGCDKASVARSMKKLGIERRKRTSKYDLLNDKEWLTKAYVEDQRSISDISREIGCAPGNVHSSLSSLNVRIRGIKETTDLRNKNGQLGGEKAANWKGGRHYRQGYVFVYISNHPYAKNSHIQEHRFIMEQHLGRYLEPYEVVHHKNGIRDDNRIENLELKERGRHISEHFKASHEVLEMRQEIEKLRKENEELRQRIKELEGKID